MPTKLDLPNFLLQALVDDKHHAVVGVFFAFQHGHLGVVKTAAPVQIDDFPPRFFHGVGIDRPADFELGFFGQLLVADFFVAQVFHKADHGPLDDLQDDDTAGRALLVRRLHVDEPAPRNQLANVALHERRVKRPADARLQLIENLRGGNRVVADDANFSHRFIGRRKRRAGGFSLGLFLAEHGGRHRREPAAHSTLCSRHVGTMAVTPTSVAERSERAAPPSALEQAAISEVVSGHFAAGRGFADR